MTRVDATGLFCPLPILMIAREVANLRHGERVELLGDDPGILQDLPAWCEETGHRLVSLEQAGDEILGVVEVEGGSAAV